MEKTVGSKASASGGRMRSVYAKTVQAANGISGAIVTPGYLRTELTVDPLISVYDFISKKDSSLASKTEVRLDSNDAFVITHIGLQLLKENPAKQGSGLLQTYPNHVVFAAEGGALNPDDLEVFYNGFLRLSVDEKQFGQNIPIGLSRFVPMGQQSTADNKSEKGGLDGTIECTPTITLNGSRKNSLQLVVPNFAGMQVQYAAAPERVKLVLVMYGFLVTQGGLNGRFALQG